jgi:4-hydroxy-3-methylbut-2-en-1-yl diphosphate reductase
MRFTATALAVLLLATPSCAFVPTVKSVSKAYGKVHIATANYMSSSVEEEVIEQRKPTKKDKRLGFMQSDNFYRKGFKEVRETVEDVMGSQFKSSTVDELKSSNYVMERDGVKVYLAKVRLHFLDSLLSLKLSQR